MKNRLFWASMIMLFVSLNALQSQPRWGFEIRPGLSFATDELGEATLETGFGFEALIDFRVLPHASVYGGWGWNRFPADAALTGSEVDVEETGYLFGLQFKHPVGNQNIAYFLRGGGIYNHLELENQDGKITHDSGHGWGWQASAGLDIPFGSNWHLKPGVKYQSLSRDFVIENETRPVDLKYITLSLGLAKGF